MRIMWDIPGGLGAPGDTEAAFARFIAEMDCPRSTEWQSVEDLLTPATLEESVRPARPGTHTPEELREAGWGPESIRQYLGLRTAAG